MSQPDRGRHGQSIAVLTEDSERTEGTDAQTANIDAAKAIAEAVRTTLGPNGMDKMLVSDSGDVVITNDGSTVLEEMDIDHPAADVLVEVAESQRETVGDGTTTTAVLAGELLAAAETLIERDVHPTTIVQGYAIAWERAMEAIDQQQRAADDAATLRRVVEAALSGKGLSAAAAATLAETIVDAVEAVTTDSGVDRDRIDVVARSGRGSMATELIDGLALEEEPIEATMPRRLTDATVAVIGSSLETAESRARFQDHDVQYSIDSADQFRAATAVEQEQLDAYAQRITHAGVDLVIVTETEDIDDRVAAQLSRAGVLAFDDVMDEDAEAIRRATGAEYVHHIEELGPAALGSAGAVRVETIDEDTRLRIEDPAGRCPTTILVRGSTDHVLAEVERAVNDGLDAAIAARGGGVVPGAGATELAVARAVRESAAGTRGREQLVVERFADALEVLPRTLATNAGMAPIDALAALRARMEDGDAAGIVGTGREATIADAAETGVLDPADVKRQAIQNAAEAATLIVRIDDVISAK